MNNQHKITVLRQPLLVFLVAILGGCSVTKHLPAGESLYVGAAVQVRADSGVAKAEVKNIQSVLTDFAKPKPNATIFGFPYKVWFYYLLGEPKSEKGLKYSFRKRFGEPPILASKSATTANTKQMTLLLNNEGYFRSVATGELVEKNRKATAVYSIALRQRYYVDTVLFTLPDTSLLSKVFRDTQPNSLLKKGTPYRFQAVADERVRIDNILKKSGFYFFQPDFIIVKADSSLGSHKVNLSVEIKPATAQAARKVYYIRDVHVLADFGETIADKSRAEKNFDGLKINDKTESYKPKTFAQAIGFRRGGHYSNQMQDISLARLINLNGNFKFVRNTFELVPRSDSALLDVFYYVTPLKAKSFGLEINGKTKSNNFTGTDLSVSWANRNTFGGAELFKISAATGFDFQVGGASVTLGAVNSRTFKVATTLTIPRFVIPFVRINPAQNQSLPKTNFGAEYEVINRRGLYNLTSLRTTMGYAWKQNSALEHAFTPVSVNLVKASDVSLAFSEDIFRSDNPIAYFRILENTVIMSSSYTVNYTPIPKPGSKHQFTFTGGAEVAGNLASLLSKLEPQQSSSVKTIFGVSLAQYARFDGDFRYLYTVKRNLKIANRFVVGYGLPYGNSTTLPFVKQYSAGGNNSIRAFAARAVGPGNYFSNGAVSRNLLGSQSGDIRLEFNTELRVKFNKYVEGAVFVDAGNVWMQKDEESYGQAAVFGSDFYKQIAIGTGLGLRLDFSYLVLRFDLATPVRKPFLPESERWVLSAFDLRSKQWRSENLVLNIAVGYPF